MILPKNKDDILSGEYCFVQFRGFSDEPNKTYKTEKYELSPGDITIMAKVKPVLKCFKVLGEDQVKELKLEQEN